MTKSSKKLKSDLTETKSPSPKKSKKNPEIKGEKNKGAGRKRLNQIMINLLAGRRKNQITPSIDSFVENHPSRSASSMMSYLQDWIELDDLQNWAEASKLSHVAKECEGYKRNIETMCVDFRAQTTFDMAAKLLLQSC